MASWFQVVASRVQIRRRQARPGRVPWPERPRPGVAWLAAGVVCWGLAAAGCATPSAQKPSMACSQLGGPCSAPGSSCCDNLLCTGIENSFCVAP